MVNITADTIVSVNTLVCANEVPEYLSEMYERAMSFMETALDIKSDIGDDREVWSRDVATLEQYNVVEATRISNLLYPFNEEEQKYIINYLNNMIDEGCEFNLDDVIQSINMNASWYSRDELEEEYNEAAANDDVDGMSFEDWLADKGHVYFIDAWRVFYQGC